MSASSKFKKLDLKIKIILKFKYIYRFGSMFSGVNLNKMIQIQI